MYHGSADGQGRGKSTPGLAWLRMGEASYAEGLSNQSEAVYERQAALWLDRAAALCEAGAEERRYFPHWTPWEAVYPVGAGTLGGVAAGLAAVGWSARNAESGRRTDGWDCQSLRLEFARVLPAGF